jgi:Txe/YoeB family toxin of Txe-Axe toxin-antitoxin module
VLVAHGRWSRGIDFENEKVYFLDNDEMLAVQADMPSGIAG